jgi:hypothetical protein
MCEFNSLATWTNKINKHGLHIDFLIVGHNHKQKRKATFLIMQWHHITSNYFNSNIQKILVRFPEKQILLGITSIHAISMALLIHESLQQMSAK